MERVRQGRRFVSRLSDPSDSSDYLFFTVYGMLLIFFIYLSKTLLYNFHTYLYLLRQ